MDNTLREKIIRQKIHYYSKCKYPYIVPSMCIIQTDYEPMSYHNPYSKKIFKLQKYFGFGIEWIYYKKIDNIYNYTHITKYGQIISGNTFNCISSINEHIKKSIDLLESIKAVHGIITLPPLYDGIEVDIPLKYDIANSYKYSMDKQLNYDDESSYIQLIENLIRTYEIQYQIYELSSYIRQEQIEDYFKRIDN